MSKYPAPDLPPPRIIHGVCHTEAVVDHAGDGSNNCVMTARGFPLVTPIPLLLNHKGAAIGKVVHLRRIGTLIYCRAIIFNNAVWRQIVDVKLRGMSCSFRYGRPQDIQLKDVGLVKSFDQYEVREISIVSKPGNDDCFFRIFSGGFEMPVAGQLSLSEHHRAIARAREAIAKSEAREASDRPTPTRRRDARPLTGEDDPRLARMHPDSRRLLLELRKKGV